MEAAVLATEERGKGPVLAFIHGFPLHAGMWRAQVTALPKHATCVAIDLRGHGMSAGLPVAGTTIDRHADDIAATLDDLGIDRIDVCALSMGGYVAFAFWQRHRAKVRSLIMVDTKAEADGDEAKAGRDAMAELARTEGMEPILEKLRGALLGDAPSDAVVADLERIVLACDPATAAADCIAMRDRTDFTDLLGSIDVPVTWIHGAQDKIMPLEAAQKTVAQLPDATLVVIDATGHLAPMEQPDAVNDAIVAHLQRIRG